MSPKPKAQQSAGTEYVPPKSKKEQVASNGKMPRISREERDRMIKQRQTARVDRLITRRIAEFRTAVNEFLHVCEPERDRMVQPSDLNFDKAKAEEDFTTRWVTINELCEKNNAVLLFIGQFDSDFRREWKGLKKGSREKRHQYLKEKRGVFKKMRKGHMDVVRELFEKVGVTLPKVDGKDTTDEEADMNIDEAEEEGEVKTDEQDGRTHEQVGTGDDNGEAGGEQEVETRDE